LRIALFRYDDYYILRIFYFIVVAVVVVNDSKLLIFTLSFCLILITLNYGYNLSCPSSARPIFSRWEFEFFLKKERRGDSEQIGTDTYRMMEKIIVTTPPQRLNLMVMGASGLGKRTFLKSLLEPFLLSSKAVLDLSRSSPESLVEEIGACEMVAENSGALVEVHCYRATTNRAIDNTRDLDDVVDYLHQQHEGWASMDGQLQPPNSSMTMKDTRIHALIYFIAPHNLTALDEIALTTLVSLTPVIPVVAKSDSMIMDERLAFLLHISTQINHLCQSNSSATCSIFDFAEPNIDGIITALPATTLPLPLPLRAANNANTNNTNEKEHFDVDPSLLLGLHPRIGHPFFRTQQQQQQRQPSVSPVETSPSHDLQELLCAYTIDLGDESKGVGEAKTNGTNVEGTDELIACCGIDVCDTIPPTTISANTDGDGTFVTQVDLQTQVDQMHEVAGTTALAASECERIGERFDLMGSDEEWERLGSGSGSGSGSDEDDSSSKISNPPLSSIGNGTNSEDEKGLDPFHDMYNHHGCINTTTTTPDSDMSRSTNTSTSTNEQDEQLDRIITATANSASGICGQRQASIRNVFAVACSNQSRIRVYPWGTMCVENNDHSDMPRLRSLIFKQGHLSRLIEQSHRCTLNLYQVEVAMPPLARPVPSRGQGQMRRAVTLIGKKVSLLWNSVTAPSLSTPTPSLSPSTPSNCTRNEGECEGEVVGDNECEVGNGMLPSTFSTPSRYGAEIVGIGIGLLLVNWAVLTSRGGDRDSR
jgi:hypothetical protein